MGGLSAEREVSIKTGEAISTALSRRGYRQKPILVDRDLPFRLKEKEIEVAFIALHGRYGEDGAIQGLLEVMNIPYTGSGITASAVAMDKMLSRELFRAHGIATPPTYVLNQAQADDFRPDSLSFKFPVVVKPASEGSSVGISLVENPADFQAALKAAFQYGPKILIERYLSGMEVQVGILGDRALGAIEIRPKGRFYDYNAKYVPGMSEHIFPAPLAPEIYQAVLGLGLEAHRALGCSGYSRADFLVEQSQEPFLLELNSLPGMTETSLMPEIAKGVGIDFDTLVESILDAASREIT